MIIYPFTEKNLPNDLRYSENKDQIARFNECCSQLTNLIEKIDNKLFHRCSIQSFQSILKDGMIYPNNGQYNHTYPQSATYIGGQNRWICLFDLTVSPFYAMWVHDTWMPFLMDMKPCTILLILDINELENIVENPFCGNEDLNSNGCIPYLEIWHTTPIKTSAIQEVIFVPQRKPNECISSNLEIAKKIIWRMDDELKRNQQT